MNPVRNLKERNEPKNQIPIKNSRISNGMNKLMTHVVAGYPTEEKCIELMRGMEQAGVEIIEVQIPFSDPIADGETIMQANDVALEHGMTTAKSFELIKRANLKTNVYIMSYFQKIQAFGLEKFCKKAKFINIKGLIIPDLPFDAPEFVELKKAAKKNNLEIVPVVSPGMNDFRLKQSIARAELIYLTSMKGITGNNLDITDELTKTSKQIKKINSKARLAVGFGVSSKKDVKEVLKIADLAVVGSALIRKINQGGVAASSRFVQKLS